MIFNGWSKLSFWHYGNSCIFIDRNEIDIAIDVMWNGGPKNNQMAIEVFQRKETADKIEDFLKPMLQLEGFSWIPDKARYTYYFDGTGIEQEDFKLMDEKFKSVVTFIDITITR